MTIDLWEKMIWVCRAIQMYIVINAYKEFKNGQFGQMHGQFGQMHGQFGQMHGHFTPYGNIAGPIGG